MTTTTRSAVLLPGQHASPEGPVDLTNMYVMHHAFRRDLADFRAAVATAALGDRARWAALRQRWRIFASALHSHHSAEDAGLWPLLLDRVAGRGDDDARTVLAAMQAEHARIDPVLEECTEGFTRMAGDATEAVRRALGRSLAATDTLLDGHLGHEERDAMAIVQRYLVQADWVRVEKEHFRPAYSPREVWFVVPWALSGLPAEVRRRNLDEAGLPVKVLWRLSRRSFARQQAAAFGDVRSVRQPELGQVHTADGPVDLSAIYVMHHGFRRDLRAFTRAVPATPLDDRRAWSAMSRRWQRMVTALRHHEAVEDRWMWPAVLDGAEANADHDARATLAAMSAEHAQLDPLLDAGTERFRALAARPTAADRDRLVADLDRARRRLAEHLAHEEREALPLVQRHVPAGRWTGIARAAAREYGVAGLGFTVPWSALDVPADQFGIAFAHGGPLLRVLLAVTRRRFARSHRTAFRHILHTGE